MDPQYRLGVCSHERAAEKEPDMHRGFTRNFRPLEILTQEQVETIWSRALDVLWTTGVRIEHRRALEVLERNGCRVDYDQMRVRMPQGLVEECLRKVPSSFRLKARDPDKDIILGGSTLHFIPFPGMHTVDLETWDPRPPTRQEFIDGVRVLDACENLGCFGSYTPYFGYADVPPAMAITEGFALQLTHSTKAQFMEGTAAGSDIFNLQLAQAVGVEYCGVVACSAPLTYYEDQIDGLFRYVEAGFPVVCGGGHVMGGSGPATFAGSLILDLAMDTAPIVLAQLLRPGTRTGMGDIGFAMNMRTGSPDFGAIATSLHQVARAQLSRKYSCVIGAAACGISSSKRIDFQCGYEKALSVMTAALGGANLIWLHGGIYGELTHHPVQAVLDEEIAGMVGRFVQGITVNDDTLALELIEQVGPVPGNYLTTPHTREWWKKEQYVQKFTDRLTLPEWTAAGKKSALDYARERTEQILATHKISKPLSATEEEEVQRILKDAYSYYGKKGML
ncbi:MAG: trimethylamine methyltransferase family protein [bacterium]